MKKITSVIVAFILVLSFASISTLAKDKILNYDGADHIYTAPKVIIMNGGAVLMFDMQPIILNERTYFSFDTITDKFSGIIEWDAAKNIVMIYLGNSKL